jgi:hypothetical protein
MLSFVNKKFAFMERKMRIGLNYLTDQVEYIFKPDNITRIERVLNGKGTVVDYKIISLSLQALVKDILVILHHLNFFHVLLKRILLFK